MYMMLLV